MISMVAAVSALNTQSEKKDTSIVKIESKAKAVSYKITWNANGGKIGKKNSVKTTVKKGSKIKKMPTTPKLSYYVFNGWYSKKNSGKKVTVNTKPRKAVTYYAKWKLKVVGTWKDSSNSFVFNNNGKFKYTRGSGSKAVSIEGKYKVVGGKIYFTKIVYQPGKATEQKRNDTVFEYKFVKDSGGEYLLIPTVFNDLPYVDISYGAGFRKG